MMFVVYEKFEIIIDRFLGVEIDVCFGYFLVIGNFIISSWLVILVWWGIVLIFCFMLFGDFIIFID